MPGEGDKGGEVKSSISNKYDAVIFDLFGTLIDNFSRRKYERAFAEITKALSAPAAEFMRLWADSYDVRATGTFHTTEETLKYACDKLNLPVTDTKIKKATRIRLDYVLQAIKPRPGSVETLTRLKSEGYKTGLISDCTPEIPTVWENTPFAKLFDTTVFSCSVGIRKPDPHIYRIATDELSVPSQKCLYIGDGNSHELSGALRVGMHPVLIRMPDESGDTSFFHREEWDGTVIASLREVLALLE